MRVVEAPGLCTKCCSYSTNTTGHVVLQPNYGSFCMQGWTPLHCAAQGGNADMVDLLLSSGADARAQDVEVCSWSGWGLGGGGGGEAGRYTTL